MMAQTMRAVKLHGIGDLRVTEIGKPELGPGPGEVLVRVKAVGVCASDVHYYRDGCIGDAVVTDPLILGHEFAGIVEAVGPGVSNVKEGDRVAVEPSMPCRQCDMCAMGEINVCRNVRFCGTPPIDGALRDYLVWPADLVVPVPDSMSFAEAAMLEPLAVGVYSVDLAEPVAGRTVGVLGAGGIGLSILQAARAAGCADTFVSDLLPYRLDTARQLGAMHTFDASKPSLGDDIVAATEGRGLDIVFEAAGEQSAIDQAMRLVRPAGTVALVGIPREDSMTLTPSVIRRKGIKVQMVRRSKDTLHRSIDLVRTGKVDVSSFVSHTFPLDQVKEAFDTARDYEDNALRVVIEL